MNAEQFQRQTNVSRETLEMYQTWLNLLTHWNKRINLVSSSTLHDFWLRHALDSWQVAELLPESTKIILDMGAGAGFPGLAMAIALKDKPEAQITWVEANGKKCNFLRTVIRECDLRAKAVQSRIENFEPHSFEVITARAFAPLPKLLKHSLLFWSDSTMGLFPKGESWQTEEGAARQLFNFDLTTSKSQTSDQAKILTITNLQLRAETNKASL